MARVSLPPSRRTARLVNTPRLPLRYASQALSSISSDRILPTSIAAECIESISSDDAPGERLAVLLALLLAGLLDMRSSADGALAEREHLLGQAVRRRARRIRRPARRPFRLRAAAPRCFRGSPARAPRGFRSDSLPALSGMTASIASRARSAACAAASLTWTSEATSAGPVSALRLAASRSTWASIEASSASFDWASPTPSSTLASSAANRSCCSAMFGAGRGQPLAGLDRRVANPADFRPGRRRGLGQPVGAALRFADRGPDACRGSRAVSRSMLSRSAAVRSASEPMASSCEPGLRGERVELGPGAGQRFEEAVGALVAIAPRAR